ncbi:MAG: hypothetical protein QOD65_2599, partial [Gaiellales bacterium]|nr:hypothetical protein [Gaiellales bacterium]
MSVRAEPGNVLQHLADAGPKRSPRASPARGGSVQTDHVLYDLAGSIALSVRLGAGRPGLLPVVWT